MAWSQEAIRLSLVLCFPVLMAALVVGAVLGMVQTVMQLNEGSFNQIPRMLVVGVVVMMLLPWMAGQWIGFTESLIRSVAGGG
jgi:flagellar biosynthetic protein FliQ